MYSDHFIGRNIDDFTIEERIGRGGMAAVYRAHQPSVNRSVALKIITLDPLTGERDEFRRRFEQEAKVIASLEHIHILPIYDYGIINDELAYIAMRLLRGGSLSHLLAAGPLHLDRTCDIFTQVARGLAHAHHRGVIHRDLKPSNILLDESGNAYLTDFGLAKLMEESVDLTKSGNIVGTPVYMSPEQLRGETLDARSDIYSMGVILYHMLVGRPPFDASDTNVVSVIYQHLEKMPIPPREFNPDLPPAVEQVVMTALQKQRDDRYPSVDMMADELNIALGRRVSTASYPAVHPSSESNVPTASILQKTPVPVRRRPWMMVGAALLALLLLAGVGFLALRRPSVDFPKATILDGERGDAEDYTPTEDETRRAAERMGSEGFVAFVACNQTSEYHAAQAREIGDLVRLVGMEYRVYDGNNDEYNQLTQFERARTDGADAMIVCPLNSTLLAEPVNAATEAGIPLVLLTSETTNSDVVLIGGSDYLMGVEAGRAAGRIIREERGGRANIVILDYPSLPIIIARANGLEDGVHEFAPNVNIVGRYLGGTRENGEASIRSLIEEGVAFDAILSINDAGSFGAILALEAAGIASDEVIISSVDAEALAREYIRNNYYMRASVEVDRLGFSRASVNAIIKLLAGATLPELLLVPPGDALTREALIENR